MLGISVPYSYLLQITLDEGEDKATVHDREGVVDEEGETEVESMCVQTVFDVLLSDIRGDHAHQVLKILHEFDREAGFSRSVEETLATQILTHTLNLVGARTR